MTRALQHNEYIKMVSLGESIGSLIPAHSSVIFARKWFSVLPTPHYSTTEAKINDYDLHVSYSKTHGANMGPIWGREDPGGPHVGPVDFVIWDSITCITIFICRLMIIFLNIIHNPAEQK